MSVRFDRVGGQLTVHKQDIVAGLVVSFIVALVMRDAGSEKFIALINPIRYFWLIIYAVVLAYYVIKANCDVAWRVLHPAMPIRPGIVKVKTDLKTALGITALANSITLTPGTLTVSASRDGNLYVHWINVESVQEEAARRQIVARFEWFIKRIVE